MDSIVHQYLTKLRIIAKVPENGQLDLTNNDLNVYNPSLVGWIYRKLYGDGKKNSVVYLLSFYRELNVFTTDLMKSINIDDQKTSKMHKLTILTILAEKIKGSTVGIENLTHTYRKYHKVVSILESIRQDIIDIQLNNIISFIPNDIKTETIRNIERETKSQETLL